jgi:prophage antirepressor-like protein
VKNLKLFRFNQVNIRVIEKDGQTWWVAKDICEVLDIRNPSDVIRRLDDDERTLVLIEGASNGLPLNAVNEPGLYSVILRSRKPEAKAFKRWIVHEVLPAIRKTGTYSIEQSIVAPVVEKSNKQKQLQTEIRKINAETKLLQARADQSKEIVQFAATMKEHFSKQDARELLHLFINTITPNRSIPSIHVIIEEEIKQVLLEMPNDDLIKFVGAVELITGNNLQLSRQNQ